MEIRSLLTTIILFLTVTFAAAQEDIVVFENDTTFHRVNTHPGNSYSWEVVTQFNPIETAPSTDYRFISDSTTGEVEILWKTAGSFYLLVTEADILGCTNSKASAINVVIADTVNYWQYANAGKDTTIGSCNPYVLQGWTNDNLQLHYLWEPADLLDNPTSPHPVFIPGETTIFSLIISDEKGNSDSSSVKITVADVLAEAGDDIYIFNNSPGVLDGGASSGIDLQYHWSTPNGHIVNGSQTANPEVDGFGTYFLEVTDRFGCSSIDSVKVGMLTYAPVAQDDYDSTAYRTEVKIPVLDNDSDPDNDIDSLSLNIKKPPLNGTAYVDYTDFSIHYRPNNNYSGNDNFEYEICDTSANCSNAKVYVMVSGFRFFIPDAFSPNGDGINDYFEIEGIKWYEGNSIEIFNRWGNKVYQAKNYGISTTPNFWDGKSNTGFRLGDEELPSGTYFYILNPGNGEKRIAGSVYLDR